MLRKKKGFILLILFLIVIEQGIKLYINSKYLNSFFPIIKPWLYFYPKFNRDYSWINSLFQLGVGKLVHVLIVLFLIILIYLFYKYLNNLFVTTKIIDIMFAFIISAALCSLIDKIFWNGSLDYILLKGFFIFDLKDLYINVFIGLLVIIYLIDYKGIRKVNDKDVLKNFIKHILHK